MLAEQQTGSPRIRNTKNVQTKSFAICFFSRQQKNNKYGKHSNNSYKTNYTRYTEL